MKKQYCDWNQEPIGVTCFVITEGSMPELKIEGSRIFCSHKCMEDFIGACKEGLQGEETPCPKREDKMHCVCWYDGKECCACGDGKGEYPY